MYIDSVPYTIAVLCLPDFYAIMLCRHTRLNTRHDGAISFCRITLSDDYKRDATKSNTQVFRNHGLVVVVIYVTPSKLVYTVFDDISNLSISIYTRNHRRTGLGNCI